MCEENIIIENGGTYIRNVEKQVFFTNQVTVNQFASNVSRDKQSEGTVGDSMAQSAPKTMTESSLYPPSQHDSVLFRNELIMSAVKAELGRLVEKEKMVKGEWNISHWFVVWKFFRHYRFIVNENTQAMFIRWVKEVFGWDWKSSDFKGTNVHSSLKTKALDEWTYENICGQTAQARKFIDWKDALVDAFLKPAEKGRRDCKEQFCTVWFDTQRGR